MRLFSRKSSKKSKEPRTVYKETIKFKDGSTLTVGRVNLGEPIQPAKRTPREKYYED